MPSGFQHGRQIALAALGQLLSTMLKTLGQFLNCPHRYTIISTNRIPSERRAINPKLPQLSQINSRVHGFYIADTINKESYFMVFDE